ncbi:hypothetical protein O0L34_g8459 [Tuta absoluta]|nr:hypothetical protein O0L34_g8459 [Tuta absoluta]
MAKVSALGRLWGRLLQLRLSTCVVYFLVIITVVQLFSYGVYDYPALPLTALDRQLFRDTCPSLVHHKGKPACNWEEVVNRKHSLDPWKIPQKFDDFSPLGIVNGSYVPLECNTQFSVALLVTYRNRQSQLDVFLPYIHNFLRKQNIHYKIYLIEQQDEKPWNKGMLYNIGAKYAMSEKFSCLILHDVDLLPLDDANLYACLADGPRHMSASIDKMRYVLPYWWLVGGVLAIKTEHYLAVNGFSNRYEHWGGEDDDFFERLAEENLQILRLPHEVSRYHMVTHAPSPQNPDVWDIIAENRASGKAGRARDGLNGISYSTMKVTHHRLFTMIGVKL